MIYIVTAMYAEARAFIDRFRLKKDISHTRFQVFVNKEEEICLLISGSGPIPAAVAVGSICTEYGVGREDFLINAGVCAGIRKKPIPGGDICREGEIFLCNKIREKASGRTFYPDILYRHGFSEAQIVTGAKPYDKADEKELEKEDFYLYDMEAAAVCQAGAYFLGPHQMSFLKVVSDDGNVQNVTPEKIRELISGNMDGIADYLTCLKDIGIEQRREEILGEDAEKMLEKLCYDMHCSRVMSASLRQHIRYFVLAGTDYKTVIEEMYRTGSLPCRDKREGKKRFEELKKRLL